MAKNYYLCSKNINHHETNNTDCRALDVPHRILHRQQANGTGTSTHRHHTHDGDADTEMCEAAYSRGSCTQDRDSRRSDEAEGFVPAEGVQHHPARRTAEDCHSYRRDAEGIGGFQ